MNNKNNILFYANTMYIIHTRLTTNQLPILVNNDNNLFRKQIK